MVWTGQGKTDACFATQLPSTGPLACEGGLGGSSVVQAHHHQRHTMYEAARMRDPEEG